MPNELTISIGGDDHTSDCQLNGFNISDKLRQPKNMSLCTTFAAAALDTIVVTDERDSTIIFSGYIKEAEKEFYKNDAYLTNLLCEDMQLYLRGSGGYLPGEYDYTLGDHTEKEIITELFTLAGLSIYIADHVITGELVAIIFSASSLARILDDLAAINGRIWYVDWDVGNSRYELHYFTPGDETSPFNLSDTPNGTTTFRYTDLKYRGSYELLIGTKYGGSLVCHKAGLRSGQTVHIDNATISLSQDFMISEVNVRVLNLRSEANSLEYTVYFGDLTPPRITDLINRSNQMVSTIDSGLIPPLTNVSGQYLSASGVFETPIYTAVHKGCKCYLTAPQTINNDTATYINWDAELYDNDTMHSLVTNTWKILINTAGKYLFIIKIRWESEASPVGYRMITLLKNGVTYIETLKNTWGANDGGQIVTALLDLVVTDYIGVVVQHTQVAATDVVHGNEDGSFITAQRISD